MAATGLGIGMCGTPPLQWGCGMVVVSSTGETMAAAGFCLGTFGILMDWGGAELGLVLVVAGTGGEVGVRFFGESSIGRAVVFTEQLRECLAVVQGTVFDPD